MNSLDSSISASNYSLAPIPSAPSTAQAQSAPSTYPAPSGGSASPVNSSSQPSAPRPAQAGAEGNGQTAQKLLSRHFDEPLKNTGIKAEIHIEQGVGMIVRLVQSDTGKVVMQLPPQGVIDLVAEIQQQQDKEMKIADPESGSSDAGSSPTDADGSPSGGLIDQLA